MQTVMQEEGQVNKEQVKPIRAGQMGMGQKVKQEMKNSKTNHRFERVLILLLSIIYIYYIYYYTPSLGKIDIYGKRKHPLIAV